MKKRNERGFSLIELMVSLTLSLVVVLGMFSLYRNAVHTTQGPGGSAPSAELDNRMILGVLTAQIKLQSAGFGIASATAANQILVTDISPVSAASSGYVTLATASSAFSGGRNAVLWEVNPSQVASSSNVQCQGLLTHPDNRALYFLQSTDCHALQSQWQSASWAATPLVASGVLNASQAVVFSLATNTDCGPFNALSSASGTSSLSGKVAVTLSYGSSVQGSTGRYVVCLPNFIS